MSIDPLKLRCVTSADTESLAYVDRFYHEVYAKAFTDPTQTDRLDTWKELLRNNGQQGRGIEHCILIASSSNDVEILGGLVMMRFRGIAQEPSNVALVTFLVVDGAKKRLGVARELLDRARAMEKERLGGTAHPMLLGEVELSDKGTSPQTHWELSKKIAALSRLGFVAVEVPYAQPALRPQDEPVAFQLVEHVPDFLGAAQASKFDLKRYGLFLDEFYGYHDKKPRNSDGLAKLKSGLPHEARRRALATPQRAASARAAYVDAALDPCFNEAEGFAIAYLAFLPPEDLLDLKASQALKRLEINGDALRAHVRAALAGNQPAVLHETDGIHSCLVDICARPDPVAPLPVTFVPNRGSPAAKLDARAAKLEHEDAKRASSEATIGLQVEVRFDEALRTVWTGREYELRTAIGQAFTCRLAFAESMTVFASGHLCYRAAFSHAKNILPAALLIALQSLLGSAGFPDDGLRDEFRQGIRFRLVEGAEPARANFLTLQQFLEARLKQLTSEPKSVLRVLLEKIAESLSERSCWRARRTPALKQAPKLPWDNITTSYIEIVGKKTHRAAFECARALCGQPDNRRFASLLAGLSQNVLAFDVQGETELRDSLRALFPGPSDSGALSPASASGDVVYAAGGRMLFLTPESRSFVDNRAKFGGCPYRYLAAVSCAYNDRLLDEASRLLRDILTRGHRRRRSKKEPQAGQAPAWVRTLDNSDIALRHNFFSTFIGFGRSFFVELDAQFNSDYSMQMYFLRNFFRYEQESAFYEAYATRSEWSDRKRRIEDLSSMARDLRKQLQDESVAWSEQIIALVAMVFTVVQVADPMSKIGTHFHPANPANPANPSGAAYPLMAQALDLIAAVLFVALIVKLLARAFLKKFKV